MSSGQDITTYYKADISDLKKGITEANKNIKLAQAQFKAAASSMDDWSNSSDGISAKLKSLTTILTEQKSKLANYQKQQEEMNSAYEKNGEIVEELKAKLQELADKGVSKTSDEYKEYKEALKDAEQEQTANKKKADELKTTILNQQAAVNQTEKEIDNYNTALAKAQSEESKAKSATGQLTSTIEEQQSELDELKTKYQNVVIAQGENSSEAKTLAKEIQDLSSELKTNKDKLENAADAADELDNSLENVDTDTLDTGLSTLSVTIGNLISSGIQKLASAITDQLDTAISRVDTLNAYEKTMTNLGYTTEEVTEASEALKEGIQGLPTTLTSVVSMQQQYAALSGNIDEATALTLALNDATLAGGQGQEVANSAAEQWYQIIAKGTPDQQSWTIINSAMPAQMNQIAEAVMGAGNQSQDLFEAWQDGTVTTQEVIDALIDLDTEGGSGMASFADQALDASSGIDTSMENVKTAIANGLANIIEAIGSENIAGAFDDIKVAINEASEKVAEFISWIVDHKDEVIAGIAGISTAILAYVTYTTIASTITTVMTSRTWSVDNSSKSYYCCTVAFKYCNECKSNRTCSSCSSWTCCRTL